MLANGEGQRHRGSARTSVTVEQDLGLTRILADGTNVCVWRRELPPLLRAWLDGLSATLSYDTTADVSPESVRALFARFPDGPATRAWATDVAALVALFCELLGTKTTRASLATVTTNKCRKFHTDYKALRLVCTYAGPGTEWVDDRDVERDALCREEACVDVANARIVPRGSSIRRAGPGDVVVLKGELYAGNAGRGAVHRSPPIEATGERRIVLTLDAV